MSRNRTFGMVCTVLRSYSGTKAGHTFLCTKGTHGGCFPQGLQAALSEASKAGKPLLTMESLNALVKNGQANRALAAELIRDIPGFFHQRFYLTPPQNAFLQTAVKEKSDEIIAVAKVVEEYGVVPKFQESVRDIPVYERENGTGGIATPELHRCPWTSTFPEVPNDLGISNGKSTKLHTVPA